MSEPGQHVERDVAAIPPVVAPLASPQEAEPWNSECAIRTATKLAAHNPSRLPQLLMEYSESGRAPSLAVRQALQSR